MQRRDLLQLGHERIGETNREEVIVGVVGNVVERQYGH